ncbi:MAG: tetratricopeptide repeat protein [Vicinamibacterales bacterium]
MFPALAIFASAFLLRLTHIWQIRQAPFFELLFGDGMAYDQWAVRIAAGDWLGTSVFYQAPLYPYLLGLVYAGAGHDLLLVRVLQALLGASGCVLVALAGERLFDRQAGVIAGFLLALSAPAIFFDALIQKTALETFLMCVLLYFTTRVVDEPEERASWFLLGLTGGGLALSRENTLILLPVLCVWLWSEWRLPVRRRWAMSLMLAGGLALLLAPATIRNAVAGGGFHLTTSQLGTNLYIGNHPGADGTYQPLRSGRGTAEYERTDATDIAARAAGRALTPAEVSSYWTRRALDFVLSEPVAAIGLTARKAMLLINRVDIVDTEDMQTYAEWSWPLRLGRWTFHFGVLLPLVALGVWTRWRRLQRAWIVPAMVLAYAGGIVVFYVVARYRHPLTPFLVVFAAAGLTALPRLVRDMPRHQWGAMSAAVLVVAILANWPLLSRDAMQAVSETNLGVALQDAGRTEEALSRYRRAIDLQATDPAPYLNMGAVLQGSGRIDEAAALFVKAVEVGPDSGEARYFLAKSLLERQRTTEAIAHLREAVPRMPDSPDVRTSLGIALASQGTFSEAIGLFREVVEMSPASAIAHWNLGSALAAAGQLDEAVQELEISVRLDPAHTQARADLDSARQLRDEQRSPGR